MDKKYSESRKVEDENAVNEAASTAKTMGRRELIKEITTNENKLVSI